MENIILAVSRWLEEIRINYSVNPYIFAVIYVSTIGPFWFSLFKIIDSLRKKTMERIMFWAIVLTGATLAPFIYVAVFGRNLPRWFWFVIIAAAVISALSVLKKIKRTVKSNGS